MRHSEASCCGVTCSASEAQLSFVRSDGFGSPLSSLNAISLSSGGVVISGRFTVWARSCMLRLRNRSLSDIPAFYEKRGGIRLDDQKDPLGSKGGKASRRFGVDSPDPTRSRLRCDLVKPVHTSKIHPQKLKARSRWKSKAIRI